MKERSSFCNPIWRERSMAFRVFSEAGSSDVGKAVMWAVCSVCSSAFEPEASAQWSFLAEGCLWGECAGESAAALLPQSAGEAEEGRGGVPPCQRDSLAPLPTVREAGEVSSYSPQRHLVSVCPLKAYKSLWGGAVPVNCFFYETCLCPCVMGCHVGRLQVAMMLCAAVES